jgi:uncharacterized membrane protein
LHLQGADGRRLPSEFLRLHLLANPSKSGLDLQLRLCLFFVPVIGIAVGAAIGALSAHLSGYGIDDDFIKQVRTKVTEGTSGLFLLLGAVTADKVVEAFKGAPHFELIASNLTHEQEEKLKEAFG